MKRFIPVAILINLLIALPALSQNYFSENERYYQLTNGLELLLIQDKSSGEFNVSYTSKAGAYTENKKLSGLTELYSSLFFVKQTANPSSVQNQELTDKGIQQSKSVAEEHLSFILQFYNKNQINDALSFLQNNLTDTTITQGAIDLVKPSISKSYVSERAEKMLWREYYNRMSLDGRPDSMPEDVKKGLQIIQERNLCPQNSLLIISGNIDFKSTLEKVQQTLGRLKECNFSYFNRYPIPETSPLPYSQQILSYERTNFRAEYYFQGPTLKDDIKGVLSGTLLDLILNKYYEKGNLDISLKSLYYANPAKVEAKAESKEDFMKYFKQTEALFYGDQQPEFINEQRLKAAKEVFKKRLETITATPVLKVRLVSMMWASKDINFLPSLIEEMERITLKDLKSFVDQYIREQNHIIKLVVPAAGQLADSLEIETAAHPEDYELLFKKNTGQLLDEAQDSVFNNFLYFLKINPKAKIKIVGLASDSELLNIKDKDTYKFVKKDMEKFRIHPAALRPSSSKIRLDIYRTIKIAQMLNENGIELSRLVGSGRIAKAEEESEKSNHRVYFRPVD